MADIPVPPWEFCLKHGARVIDGCCAFCELEKTRHPFADQIRYFPVFVGKTEAEEKVVLYRTWDDKFHIKVGDGELRKLSPGSDLVTWDAMDETDETIHIRVKSPEWSGEAKGGRRDLFNEEGIR